MNVIHKPTGDVVEFDDPLLAPFQCLDCQDNTFVIGEYYMVHDEVWEQSGLGKDDGMLCIGCLEARIGRELKRNDFTDAPINDIEDPMGPQSDRSHYRRGHKLVV